MAGTNRKKILTALVVLNGWDAGVTLYFLRGGFEELNPLLAWAYNLDWLAFVAVKAGAVIAGSALLSATWDHPAARKAVVALVVLYGLLAAWHAFNLLLYLMVT